MVRAYPSDPARLIEKGHDRSWPLSSALCDTSVYYQASFTNSGNSLTSKLHQQEVPVTSSTFNSVLYMALQESRRRVPVTRFIYNCKILIIHHITKDLNDNLDFSALRNPQFLPSGSNLWLDTENTYIFAIPEQDATAQFNSHNNVITALRQKSFASRMQPLVQQHFKVGLHDLNPHYFEIDGQLHGTGYEFTIALARIYNFTYSFSLVPHEVIQRPDGTVGGWENEVASGRIDVDAFFVANYVAHRRTLEFSTPIWKLAVIYLAKVPGHSTTWTTILDVLEPRTWAALAAITVSFSFAAYARLKSSPYPETHNSGIAIFSLVYNSLVTQSVTFIPKSIRGLAILWLLCSVVMTIFFTSNLLSLLTSPVADEVIPKDMIELSKRRDYNILAMDHPGGPLEVYFNSTTTPHLVSIWRRARLLPVVNCILESITNAKTVCLGWDFIFEGILQANATINYLFEPAVTTNAGLITAMHNIIVRKNSPYADAFNQAVGWFRDTGVYLGWLRQSAAVTKHIGREWLTAQQDSKLFQVLNAAYKASIKLEAEPLELSYMIAPFIVLTCGITLAFSAFITEYLWLKMEHRLDGVKHKTFKVKLDAVVMLQTLGGRLPSYDEY